MKNDDIEHLRVRRPNLYVSIVEHRLKTDREWVRTPFGWVGRKRVK